MPSSPKEAGAAYLLDTSVLWAYLLNEPGGGQVASLYRQSRIPFIAISELYSTVWLRFGQPKADQVVATVREWKRPWVWPTEEAVFLAGRWRAIHRLGLADSFIAALAYVHQAILVTKDTDFQVLRHECRLLFLR